jgi:cell division protein FtsX
MKNILKTIGLKSIMVTVVLLMLNLVSFAAEKTTDVYVSRAKLNNLSTDELLSSPWVLMLLGYAALIFLLAFLSARQTAEVQGGH